MASQGARGHNYRLRLHSPLSIPSEYISLASYNDEATLLKNTRYICNIPLASLSDWRLYYKRMRIQYDNHISKRRDRRRSKPPQTHFSHSAPGTGIRGISITRPSDIEINIGIHKREIYIYIYIYVRSTPLRYSADNAIAVWTVATLIDQLAGPIGNGLSPFSRTLQLPSLGRIRESLCDSCWKSFER